MKKYIILGVVMFFILLLAVYMSLRGISYHEWGQELKEEAGVRKSLGYPENQGSDDKPVEGRDVIGDVNVQKHDYRTEQERSEDAQSLSPASRLKEQPHI